MKKAGKGFTDLGFAKVDIARRRRKGFPEVIFGEGKTGEQIAAIGAEILKHGTCVLMTRVSATKFPTIAAKMNDAVFYPAARCVVVNRSASRRQSKGLVAVICAGTSDLPVAEEAAVTLEAMGNRVDRIYDVGVAGIHRLFAQKRRIEKARVLIVVAGMEGALPSVVGGLFSQPLIAVPTSVGYGTGLKGVAALMSMLNSCASGMTVVNIDNGFGAGYAASQINRLT